MTKETQRFPILAGNDLMDMIAVRKEKYAGGPPVTTMVHPRVSLDDRGRMAMAFAERWAMVACEIDGEDSAGRAKVRRMTPAELSEHACGCVESLFSEFQKRGWAFPVPSYAAAVDSVKDQEDAND